MSSCVICCRKVSEKTVDDRPPDNLTMFFKLFGRHLKIGCDQDKPDSEGDDVHNNEHEGKMDGNRDLPLFGKLTNAGMLKACVECSKVVQSFCQLYNQLKEVELLLNWKVGTLQNLMSRTEKVPFRKRNSKSKDVTGQQSGIGDASTETNLIVYFRRELVKQCDRKLSTTFPRLRLERYQRRPAEIPESVCDKIKLEVDDQYLDDEGDSDPGEFPTDHFGDIVSDGGDQPASPGAGVKVEEVMHNVEEPPTNSIPLPTFNSENGKFRCPKCDKEFTGRAFFSRHYQAVHLKLKPFCCHICGRRFAMKHYLAGHLRKVHGCGAAAQKKCPHSSSSPGIRPCHLCGKVLVGKRLLLEHLRRVHSPSSDYNVEQDLPDADEVILGTEDDIQDISSLFTKVVPIPTKSIEEPETPKYVFNSETNRYKCCHCSKQFRHMKNWQLHYQHYTQVRFQCNLCKKQFKRFGDFSSHHKTAHQMVRFKCRQCGKLFKEKRILREHHRYRHQGLTYPCQKCSKTFTLKANLQSHLRKSISCGTEAPVEHRCHLCEKQYKSPASLRRHLDVNHSEASAKKHLVWTGFCI